jgi:phosphatidate cytidylyltransferase
LPQKSGYAATRSKRFSLHAVAAVLRYRLLLGTLFIAALAVLCWLDYAQVGGTPPGAWLFPLALLLSVLASGEVVWLLSGANQRPDGELLYAGNFLIVASNAVPMFWPTFAVRFSFDAFGWPVCTFALCTLVAFIVEIWRFEKPGEAIARLAATIFGLAYVGILLTFVVQLPGLLAILSLVIVVKMGDTGAYTVGRLIGRHKMAPNLSPGKTWEGAAGAALFAIIGSWAAFNLLGMLLDPRRAATEPWRWIVFGLAVGAAGLMGDLAESLLKRDAGRKDSSPWMPGFGGVLDLLDSILFAAPVAYLCWATGLVN